eukprot:GHVR01006192.1.p1 GENE.GHVR01006192.1~~GHVR01006192.1.p1  ORF type:complete len:131 (+),score=10.92 GHVR01006192.1:36-395(+)
MSKATKAGVEGEDEKPHRIRITLTSKNVKGIEKVCSDLVKGSKERKLTVKGPVRIPTKRLHITTRKSPCGQGSKTWDHFEMKIHKRLVDIISPSTEVKDVIGSIRHEHGVDIDVTLIDA